MKSVGHLVLHHNHLPPTGEQELSACGWQFAQVARGSAYWLGAGARLEVFAGDVLILFPENHGLLRASRLGEVEFHSFQFCPELLGGLLTLTERHQLRQSLARPPRAPRLLPASHPQAIEFAALSRDWAEEGDLVQRCRMLELAARVLLEEIAQAPLPKRRQTSVGGRFRVIVSQMTDSELARHSSVELAALCGCSVRHFIRLFRQHFGMPLRASRRNRSFVQPILPNPCPACLQTAGLKPSAPLAAEVTASLRESNRSDKRASHSPGKLAANDTDRPV